MSASLASTCLHLRISLHICTPPDSAGISSSERLARMPHQIATLQFPLGNTPAQHPKPPDRKQWNLMQCGEPVTAERMRLVIANHSPPFRTGQTRTCVCTHQRLVLGASQSGGAWCMRDARSWRAGTTIGQHQASPRESNLCIGHYTTLPVDRTGKHDGAACEESVVRTQDR